jgi:hypothetical protein
MPLIIDENIILRMQVSEMIIFVTRYNNINPPFGELKAKTKLSFLFSSFFGSLPEVYVYKNPSSSRYFSKNLNVGFTFPIPLRIAPKF